MSTAYEEQEYITETLRNGAFDFVVKSSDNEMEEIKDKVKNAADKAYYESILGHLICKYELKIIENIGERKKAEM
jgi:DNA-binding NarL/FixJ family response regulator